MVLRGCLLVLASLFFPQKPSSYLNNKGADEQVSLLVELEKSTKTGSQPGCVLPVLLQTKQCTSLPQKRNSLILMSILKAMAFASRTLKPNTAMDSMFTFSTLLSAW